MAEKEYINKLPIIRDLTAMKSEYDAISLDGIIKALMEAPAADVVEVVRCKDCARDGRFDCPICYIEKQTLVFVNHDPMFYCGCGERKEQSNA